jgi:mono/diheme cytochrome c family protein
MQTTSGRWTFSLFATALLVMVFSSMVLMADDASPPWVAPAREARKKNPVPADAKSIAAGKTLYHDQCLKCHGDAGKGDGASSKDLKVKPKDLSDPQIASQTDGALFWKITTGRAPMPTFEKLIPNDDDRWSVINYTRTFAPAPANTPPTSKPANDK